MFTNHYRKLGFIILILLAVGCGDGSEESTVNPYSPGLDNRPDKTTFGQQYRGRPRGGSFGAMDFRPYGLSVIKAA